MESKQKRAAVVKSGGDEAADHNCGNCVREKRRTETVDVAKIEV